jgi:ribonuclease P/MRP protein subunit RPP1
MKFYDLGIKSSLSRGQDQPEVMLDWAIGLGYAGVALADFGESTPKNIKQVRKEYSLKCNLFTRATIVPKSADAMKNRLKELQNTVDIIAVRSGSAEKNIYVNALLDKRVDVISLSEMSEFSCLDYSHFKMAKENGVLIEISTRDLILKERFQRSKAIRLMYKTCEQIVRANAPFIITSGAESKWELRAPKELIALAGLIKIPEKQAICALSSYPEMLIQKIKMMHDPNSIMAGVRIVPSEEETREVDSKKSNDLEGDSNGI